MASAWNAFVSKIFKEGRSKDPNYQFKDAMKDASSRKSEMGTASGIKSKRKRGKKSSGTRKRRRSRRR